MKATKHLTINRTECDLKKLCTEIEASSGIKLMATNENDTVDGYINQTVDNLGNATIEILLYDENELPDKIHKSTLRAKIPSVAEKSQLQTLTEAHIK